MAEAQIRLAELLLGLTGVADLGMGQPVGAAARTCQVSVGTARALGCDDHTTSDVFYAALLQHVGCTAYSHEASLLFGDELSIKRASLRTNFERPREVLLDYQPRPGHRDVFVQQRDTQQNGHERVDSDVGRQRRSEFTDLERQLGEDHPSDAEDHHTGQRS